MYTRRIVCLNIFICMYRVIYLTTIRRRFWRWHWFWFAVRNGLSYLRLYQLMGWIRKSLFFTVLSYNEPRCEISSFQAQRFGLCVDMLVSRFLQFSPESGFYEVYCSSLYFSAVASETSLEPPANLEKIVFLPIKIIYVEIFVQPFILLNIFKNTIYN